ncbi:hypothetical protein AB1Y20_009134 [Prymnesium parvum]|uniref:Uncharacterized protein n=1 Tax=Prymnesium parvum TaxID=97485 RepID=A0AB34K1A6_PRYPA
MGAPTPARAPRPSFRFVSHSSNAMVPDMNTAGSQVAFLDLVLLVLIVTRVFLVNIFVILVILVITHHSSRRLSSSSSYPPSFSSSAHLEPSSLPATCCAFCRLTAAWAIAALSACSSSGISSVEAWRARRQSAASRRRYLEASHQVGGGHQRVAAEILLWKGDAFKVRCMRLESEHISRAEEVAAQQPSLSDLSRRCSVTSSSLTTSS